MEVKECYENINQLYSDNLEKDKKIKNLIDQLDLSGKEKNKIWEEILKINQTILKKERETEIFKKERDLRH